TTRAARFRTSPCPRSTRGDDAARRVSHFGESHETIGAYDEKRGPSRRLEAGERAGAPLTWRLRQRVGDADPVLLRVQRRNDAHRVGAASIFAVAQVHDRALHPLAVAVGHDLPLASQDAVHVVLGADAEL